jgi:hypothetical protein
MPNNSDLYEFSGVSAAFPKNDKNNIVYLMRNELSLILNVYGRMVAGGKWFDYAIDAKPNLAIFSVYRRASEMPLYQIIKEPALSVRQGAWRILSMNGQVVKRGKELSMVLRYFDNKLIKLID